MSSGTSCKCEERKKPIDQRNWVVTTYRGNHSAFNGYRFAPSDYSAIRCNTCSMVWRTKAPYATQLHYRIKTPS